MTQPVPINATAPFVLLDDAADGGNATLFRDPVDVVAAHHLADIPVAMGRLREARARGLHAAGQIGYSARAAFEPRLGDDCPDGTGLPLLWFGLFESSEIVDASQLLRQYDHPNASIANLMPNIGTEAYADAFQQIKDLIEAGDIYQANLTFGATVELSGHPLSIYRIIRTRGGASWDGVVFTGSRWILSASPELFFRLKGRRLITRPMKGTAPLGVDPSVLRDDPKQRAENLMIVDLLRNDMARVATPGTVRVTQLFEIERYPTVQQMTSTIEAEVSGDRDALDVLAALFPCGSITGAPKIRAVEITNALEDGRRGIYTGSIGTFDADGNAALNVAIRTLVLSEDCRTAHLGLGSAIVADSDVEAEWAECLAKSRFACG